MKWRKNEDLTNICIYAKTCQLNPVRYNSQNVEEGFVVLSIVLCAILGTNSNSHKSETEYGEDFSLLTSVLFPVLLLHINFLKSSIAKLVSRLL